MAVTKESIERYLSFFTNERELAIAKANFAMARESDRGVAIIAAALIDSEMECLIRHLLLDCRATHDLFSSKNGALHDMYSKTLMLRALGAIYEDELQDINTIRTVRNVFAHQADCSFADQSIRDRVSRLTVGVEEIIEKGLFEQWHDGILQRYRMVCTVLLSRLRRRSEDSRLMGKSQTKT